MTDTKSVIREKASNALETIGENFTGDLLLPILLKVSEDSNSKIRLGCLEYILHIIPQCTSYLNHPNRKYF